MKSTKLLIIFLMFLYLITGCNKVPKNPMQEEQKKVLKNKGRLVGNLASPANMHLAKIQGVTLARGLADTGANEKPSFYQQMVLKELQRDIEKKDHVREEIASLSTAVVILEAVVPPGAKKGDRLDLEVVLPPESEATSLQGGFVEKASMHQYLAMDTLRIGDRLGIANGYILLDYNDETKNKKPASTEAVNSGSDDKDPKKKSDSGKKDKSDKKDKSGKSDKSKEAEKKETDSPAEQVAKKHRPDALEKVNLKRGRIPGGVVVTKSRPIWLEINRDDQTAGVAQRIEDVINNRFSYKKNGSKRKVAEAKWGAVRINLIVPEEYEDNVSRYINIICAISFFETPDELNARLSSLKAKLLDPETSEFASVQLEAIGPNNPQVVEALHAGMNYHEETVRFNSAISVAYMNIAKERNQAANVLAEFARTNHKFRPAALAVLGTTLKSSFEADARLRELLSDNNEETRYGAFRALCTRNSKDYMIMGENMNDYFNYHCLNCGGVPLVHISESNRPEIVLFAKDNIFLQGTFNIEAGSRITVRSQGAEVIVKKYKSGIDEQRIVNYRLDDIIRAVIDVGGTYPDVVELLRKAQEKKYLVAGYGQGITPCPLAIDALPGSEKKFHRLRDMEELAMAEAAPPEEPKSTKSFWHPTTWFSSSEEEKAPSNEDFGNDEFESEDDNQEAEKSN